MHKKAGSMPESMQKDKKDYSKRIAQSQQTHPNCSFPGIDLENSALSLSLQVSAPFDGSIFLGIHANIELVHCWSCWYLPPNSIAGQTLTQP